MSFFTDPFGRKKKRVELSKIEKEYEDLYNRIQNHECSTEELYKKSKGYLVGLTNMGDAIIEETIYKLKQLEDKVETLSSELQTKEAKYGE